MSDDIASKCRTLARTTPPLTSSAGTLASWIVSAEQALDEAASVLAETVDALEDAIANLEFVCFGESGALDSDLARFKAALARAKGE